MSQQIKVGDPVIYRPGFGLDPPVLVKIKSMQVTDYPHERYGADRQDARWSLVEADRILFYLDDGHWSHSDQIDTTILPSVLRDIVNSSKKDLPTHMGRHPALDAWIGKRLEDLEEEERLNHDD